MSIALSVAETGHVNPDISEGWTVVEGTPTMTTWFEYQSPDKSLVTGTWRATVGTFHAAYKFHEFVTMIEGEIDITPENGQTVTVRAGDSFNVEPDFVGTWVIRKPVLKRFLIKLT